MTQHLTAPNSRPVGHVATPPSFTEAAGPLGAAIRAVRRGVTFQPLSADVRQAAWQHLRAIEPLFAPGTQDHMAAWLGRLAPAVVNAPSDPREIRARYAAIWDLCADLPVAVWCDETRRAWLRTMPAGKFWPVAGELFAHLDAFAMQLRIDRDGCEALQAAVANTDDEPDHHPDEAERAVVTEMMRGWRSERAATQVANTQAEEARRLTPKAAPVTDHELLAMHEAAAANGSGPSAFRAAALRQKLGVTEEVAYVGR